MSCHVTMSQFSHLVQEGKAFSLLTFSLLSGNGSKRPFKWSFSFGSSHIYLEKVILHGIDIVLLDIIGMISLNYHIVTIVSPAFSVLWKNCTAVIILLRIL